MAEQSTLDPSVQCGCRSRASAGRRAAVQTPASEALLGCFQLYRRTRNRAPAGASCCLLPPSVIGRLLLTWPRIPRS
eukprot:3635103-Rhodomonas_salina.1